LLHLFKRFSDIQGDFESCADILTRDRTPQKVTIQPIMPYTNIDIFREKGAKGFSKQNLGATEFIISFFVVIYFKIKFDFDKNQMAFTNLEKIAEVAAKYSNLL
jgi:hypothetical protein